jgi:hypothetical protein
VFSYQSNDSYLESFFNLFKTENKNYFICDYTESDMSRTFIIDTKRKEFIWGKQTVPHDENFIEGEVFIKVTEYVRNDDGSPTNKIIWEFDKFSGKLELKFYRIRIEEFRQSWAYSFTDTWKCRKTEPLVN